MTSPDHLAGNAQLVEITGAIVLDSSRQNLPLEDAGRKRETLELLDDVEETVEAPARAGDSLPMGKESAEGHRFDGLDLFAKAGQ